MHLSISHVRTSSDGAVSHHLIRGGCPTPNGRGSGALNLDHAARVIR